MESGFGFYFLNPLAIILPTYDQDVFSENSIIAFPPNITPPSGWPGFAYFSTILDAIEAKK